jgi:hypothetical protein
MRRTQKGLATLLILAASHSMNAQCIGDLNEDLAVDLHDLLMLLIHYGDSCSGEAAVYPTLHISEIHYNPNSGQGNDSDWEFLELYNPMDVPVPLDGWRLSNAVTYQFDADDTIPALGFFAVARNLDSLVLMMPDGAHSAQWNSGESLNNTGETIELWSPDDIINQSVAYEDNDGWVAQPDGQGPSLEWIDPGLDNGAVDSWTYSLVFGGTPGVANSMWGLSDPE